jgi:nucleoside-diphosphate-sugar epimerase
METTRPQTFLVTGASGFVGQHFIEVALRSGAHVVALLHRPAAGADAHRLRRLFRQRRQLLSLPHGHERLTIVEGSLGDRDGLAALFAHVEVDAVVHFAGITRLPQARKDQKAALDVNVEGTRRLAEVADAHARARRRPMHFVFSSTIRVFEGTRFEELDANGPRTARSVYARSKVLAEETLEDLQRLAVTITYVPNFFGLGESSTVIPIWFTNALTGQAIPVWGDGSTEVRFTRVEPFCARLVERLARPPRAGVVERQLERGEYCVTLAELAQAICGSLDRLARQGVLAAPRAGGRFTDLIRHVAHENV